MRNSPPESACKPHTKTIKPSPFAHLNTKFLKSLDYRYEEALESFSLLFLKKNRKEVVKS